MRDRQEKQRLSIVKSSKRGFADDKGAAYKARRGGERSSFGKKRADSFNSSGGSGKSGSFAARNIGLSGHLSAAGAAGSAEFKLPAPVLSKSRSRKQMYSSSSKLLQQG